MSRSARKESRTGKLRLAYVRIVQETNALSPVRTSMDDFRRTHFLEGEELARGCEKGGVEAKGFLRNAELTGFVRGAREADPSVELVPLFSAWAVPSGPLSKACFSELNQRLVDSLEAAGPVDGVFLCLHGAMGAEGIRDPESELLRSASKASGGARLAVSYDLHANLTQERVELASIIAPYRTNPHRDHVGAGATAGNLLVRTLRGEINPTTAWRSLPMILGGGNTLDFWPPMFGIFRRMKEMQRKEKALNVGVCMSHPWNSDPELGWSTLAITDNDQALAEKLADELAERCWAVRHQLPPDFMGPEEAVEAARKSRLARKLGVVVLSDASDIVTAGSTGDNTALLKAVIEKGQGLLTYFPIRDPEAIEKLWQHSDGERVSLEVGGTVDKARHTPLAIEGRILRRLPAGQYGRMMLLEVGDVRLVITEGDAIVMKPDFYQQLGLSIMKADVVVVKNLFPFRLYFLPYSRRTIYVRTKGITDFDAAFEINFAGPVHPRDSLSEWRSTDRRRRGLASGSDTNKEKGDVKESSA